MSGYPEYAFTQDRFEEMSWHDNHVHALRVVQGQHGAGELILDIDYILEWLCGLSGSCSFRIVPSTLVFHEVTNLQVTLDYASVSAALGPFSIHEVRREFVPRERYVSQIWTLALNWPSGEIRFESGGFTQTGRRSAVESDTQVLTAGQRT